jgi:branched-chain amino acid transport system ATP-binding protein
VRPNPSLLLDEPFEGVAPVLARRLAEVIASLRKTGLTVVLSESSLTHAHGLLDRVYRTCAPAPIA